MRSRIRRAAVAAGAALVLLGPATGVARASGAPVLSWAPTTSAGTYNYGTLTAGQTLSQAFTLTNSGGTATSALKIRLAGSSAFTKTADTCTATSLGPKKSCSVTITYAPTTSGQTDKATLTATSNKPSATASLTLLGAAQATPATISTTPSAGGPLGTTVTDTATLSGGASPTGTIEFTLYGPSATADCGPFVPIADHETVTVDGNGTYTTPTGATLFLAGTYWWVATYSGDSHNNKATSGCGSESVTITPGA
jgi:hypothetical protein